MNKTRCAWPGADELNQAYHDQEWGVPLHDDRMLFEFLTLEGAQAGLSWITILRKRESYRTAFDHFEIERVARYDQHKIDQLLQNTGIVRNRLKVQSTILNAQKVIEMQQEYGSFDAFIWRFVDGVPHHNHWRSMAEVPSSTAVSDTMSKELKRRGFKFVGSTICYAMMQATGMVNDHTSDCFKHAELKK